MNGRTRFRRDNKKSQFIKDYNGHKFVELYDRQHPEGTRTSVSHGQLTYYRGKMQIDADVTLKGIR